MKWKYQAAQTAFLCLVAGAIVSTRSQTQAQGQPAAQPPAAVLKETTATDIPGVIKGGTKIVLIKEGFGGTEGPISMPDGSLLFCEYDTNKLIKIDRNDNISTYLENGNGCIGLAYDHNGRLIATQMGTTGDPMVGVFQPARKVLADKFEGQILARPNDLVIDKKGGIYFTDMLPTLRSRPPREAPPGRKPLLFYIKPSGELMKLTEYVTSPNGVQLSPDEKTLYATNGQNIVAFDVQADGSVTNPRNFVMSGGDGLAVDNAGRLYSAVGGVSGVRVFSPQGQDLGTIPVGAPPQSVAFAGPDKRTLYIVGRGTVYKTQMIAQGIMSRAK